MNNADLPAMPVSDLEYLRGLNGGEARELTKMLGGVTKREHFAAMAMQGMLANSELMKTIDKSTKSGHDLYPTYASLSLLAADALLAALEESE